MIGGGIVLGTVGIAVVFGFLLLLVLTMSAISAFARPFADAPSGTPGAPQTQQHSREAEIAAAVAAAKSRAQSSRARRAL